MFPPNVFASSLGKLATILRSLDIRFHLTGGIAAAAYGDPRMTQDLDIVADPRQVAARLEELLAHFAQSDFLFNEASVRGAVQKRDMFQLLDKVESLKLDVYVREMIPNELDRSVEKQVFADASYPIASRGDVALSKLVWISKGSHKSRADLRALHRGADEATRDRIATTAETMGLNELLEQVLAEPDEIV